MILSKIRLINWHQFWNNTIDIDKNVLITGENGCGKSTLLDAVFFVISGGESKMFNKAANNESARTVESYMRCKLGVEGKTCERNNPDLISHIALELKDTDTNKIKTLGCVFEIHGSAEPKWKFYCLDRPLDKIQMNSEKEIFGFDGMKKAYGISLFSDMNKTKKENRKLIATILGLNRNAYQKYFDLLCKAIAFDPIKGDVSGFVNDFLLKEDNVNIDSLQNELRNYREIEESIKREQNKQELLEKFIGNAEKYRDNLKVIQYLNIVKADSDMIAYQKEINRLTNDISKKKDSSAVLNAKKNDLQIQKEYITKRLDNLRDNDLLKALNEAEKIQKASKEKYDKVSELALNCEKELSAQNRLLRTLGLSFSFGDDIRERNFPLLNSHIKEYLMRKKETDSKLRNKNAECKQRCSEECSRLKAVTNNIEKLQRNLHDYEPKLQKLMDEIRNSVAQKYHKAPGELIIRPLCECLEVNEMDVEWTNALEGYLNTQRFDLVIQPEYYEDALRVTDLRKDINYGIIDVKHANGSVQEGSLFEKVTVTDDHATGILKLLLGNVICVDSVSNLSGHKIAITKSCMLYRNYTARNLSQRAYQTPYIGKNSVIKRIENYQLQEKECKKNIVQWEEQIKKNNTVLDMIDNSTVRAIVPEDYWSRKDTLEDEIARNQQTVERLSESPDIFRINDQIKKSEEEKQTITQNIKELEDGVTNNDRLIGQAEGSIRIAENNLAEAERQKEQLLSGISDMNDYRLKTEEYYDGSAIKADIVKTALEKCINFNNSTKAYILDGMREYTAEYPGLLVDIDSIFDFMSEYNRILENDIPSLRSKAHLIYNETLRNFNDNFISVIRDKIDDGIAEIRDINKNLKSHPFGNSRETYEFVWKPSSNQEMGEYYRIIKSGKDMEQRDLFTERLDQKDRDIIERLFEKLSSEGNQEAHFNEYLDYRKYLSYDIKINYGDGNSAYFSKVHKEKSGGETQTPFYVIMGSCFDELINKRDNAKASCLVIFDEAFNNMDELRIQSLMGFYKELNLQLMIVVPSNRCHNLMPYVDSVIALIRSNDCIESHLLTNGVSNGSL